MASCPGCNNCCTRHTDKNVLVVIDCSIARRAMYIKREIDTVEQILRYKAVYINNVL